jgi:hypothetical protein
MIFCSLTSMIVYIFFKFFLKTLPEVICPTEWISQ